tara:strand:- start:1655 stop:2356 length:702 start_codon:yes stop_codon:yes gene_type:complete
MKKIEIFSRHCEFSKFSENRERVNGFSKEACYKNMKNTLDRSTSNLTFLMDGELNMHFLNNEKEFKVENIEGGSQAKSWDSALDYVKERNFNDEQIIYFVEDDYLHLNNWSDILLDGFELNIEHLSLYDHLDKYKLPLYKKLQSSILIGKKCHWRSVPSTTLSFAVKFKNFKKYFNIYKKFNFINEGKTKDHEMFLELWKNGSNLITPIPGYASHMDLAWLSPMIDWEKKIKK